MLTNHDSLGRSSPSRARGPIPYAVGVALAALAILLPVRWLESPKAVSRVGMVPVVVAAKDIAEGMLIDRAGLAVSQWPAGTRPAGAYTTVDSAANRVARVPIYRGEAIVPGRLAPQGNAAGLDVRITPGKRAYAIRLDDLASLGGMVQPNSRVDIMVVVDNTLGPQRTARLFMENMRVLAIGAGPARAQNGASIRTAVASIEVTPKEAERLAIASALGTLQLVLRGYGDPDSARTNNAATPMRDLLLRSPRRPAAVAPPQQRVAPVRLDTFRLRVYRGVRNSAPDSRDSTRRR